MPSPPSPVRPRLRRLDVTRVERTDAKGIVLRDPLGVGRPLFVPLALVPLVARLDGSHTQVQLERAARELVPGMPADFVATLLADLDAAGVLESPHSAERLAAAVTEFAGRGARPARHPGSAGYPAERAALERALSRIVPGSWSGPRTGTLRGLVAPHIDLARGAQGYAAAYSAVRDSEPADLYVVFGTGHQGPSAPLTGLALDWETPLGTVPTDRAFVAAVHGRLGTQDPRDVLLHRDEHSVEFQVLMLRWALRDVPFQVAGFLTGALPTSGDDPLAEGYVQDLLGAVREAAVLSGRRVCFVAGADLAHRGPVFGDPSAVADADLVALEARERARLHHLEAGAPGAFFAAVEADANPDRVCGTVPILLTAALAGTPARVLHYGQARATDASQVVTFCAAAFAT